MYEQSIKKKYFLYYLPIYGTVAEAGDKCWYKVLNKSGGLDGVVPAHLYKSNNEVYVCVGSPHPKYNNEPKVELFVCTNDIKIGDIVKERLTTGDMQDWEIHNLNDIDLPNQLKVIGKVSPAAIWATQFTEFDWYGIETAVPGEENVLYYNKELTHWSKEKDDYYQYVKVKCNQCQTFH